jgi:hypothetical protein
MVGIGVKSHAGVAKVEKGADGLAPDAADGNNNNNNDDDDDENVVVGDGVRLPSFSLNINNGLMFEPPLRNEGNGEVVSFDYGRKYKAKQGIDNESERSDTEESGNEINESGERRMSIQTVTTCSTLNSYEINNYLLLDGEKKIDGIKSDDNASNVLIDDFEYLSIYQKEKEEKFSNGREEEGEENEDELDVVGGWDM